jgi:very-short-patch-repair endonuclease
MSDKRCERIAELLLLEKEIKQITKVSACFSFSDVCAAFDYFEASDIHLTPIEKVMLAILYRIQADKKCDIFIFPQEYIENYRVDFLIKFPEHKERQIIIECDGHDFHEKTKEQARHDKERDRYFVSNGYEVYHYTGSEIYNDFDDIEKQLEEIFVFGGEK